MPTSVPEHVTTAVDIFCRRAEVPHDGYVYSVNILLGLCALTPRLDPVGPFLCKARWIPRLISPFITMDVVYSMIPSDQP
jgi:hypothetical protein